MTVTDTKVSMTVDERIESLEKRVAELELKLSEMSVTQRRAPASRSSTGSPTQSSDTTLWTRPYAVSQLEFGDTWIEMHEPSARPHIQRMIRQVVEEEGPVTDHLILRRIREAWGLKRAGGRVQQVIDQNIRQLISSGVIERCGGDAVCAAGKGTLTHTRVPDETDPDSRRSIDEIPQTELAFALACTAWQLAPVKISDLTMEVSRVFGWSRRGKEIQTVFDELVASMQRDGRISIEADTVQRPSTCPYNTSAAQ